MSTIFISHSSQDNAWAGRIRDWLRDEEGQRPQEQRYRALFLDFDPEDGLQGGERWRDQLFAHLEICAAVIVICSEAYAASQWCLAELGVAMASGKLVLPVRTEASSPLPRLLSETQATALAVMDLEGGAATGWERLLRGLAPLSWQSRLPWPPVQEPGAAPFPGLETFERRHAAVFFGQDAVRRQVQDTIRRLPRRQSRLLLILGASGCGKSSLLRAGLVPWLEAEDRRRWIVFEPFRPDTDPFAALAAALRQAHRALDLPAPAAAPATAAAVRQQLRDLRLLSGRQDARVVIPIDQFEELLGRGDAHDPQATATADAFLTLLAELLAEEGGQLLLLATLRSDFYGALQLHPSALHRRAGSPIPLGPMDVDGFREVIEGPARRVGLRLGPGLSDVLVRDTATGDALPLLAFTLRELWEGLGAEEALTVAQYEGFGGLAGAVRRRAEEVLESSGATAEEIEALRRAFLDHLIRLTSDGQAAKQPARLEALPPASRRLARLFVEARLLVSGKGEAGDRIEIAHEALLRTWPKLLEWIDSGKVELLQRLRVRRLGDDLTAEAPERQRRQALEQLAALATSGEDDAGAVEREARQSLADVLAHPAAPEADRQDAALLLALIGAEAPLRACLADPAVPVDLRRRAAESLGLLARRCGDGEKRRGIERELEAVLRGEPLDVRIVVELDGEGVDPEWERELEEAVDRYVEERRVAGGLTGLTEGEIQVARRDLLNHQITQRHEQLRQERAAEGQAPGWKDHDARLPLPQGAARGLQLAAAAELPLLGGGPGRVLPMLTLTALEEDGGLHITTQVVEVPVWRLPLPAGEQLELVALPGGDHRIGSAAGEAGREGYTQVRQRCEGVDVEAERTVRLAPCWLARHPISQAQWRAVVEAMPELERGGLQAAPGTHRPETLWEMHGQPGALPVDSVSWTDCGAWLGFLNGWLQREWTALGGQGEAPRLALPSESQWEAACRAGSAAPFHFGATLDARWARYDASRSFGMGRTGEADRRPAPIGFSGLVNLRGLADLHGQLVEWCGDQWHRDPAGEGWPEEGGAWEGKDPGLADVPLDRECKLLRGGSWFDGPPQLPLGLPGQPPPRRPPRQRWVPRLLPPPGFPSWLLIP